MAAMPLDGGSAGRALHGAPPDPGGHVEPRFPQRAAAALSVAATILLTILLRASHPPAASTTLLFSLGALDSTWREAGLVIAGIVLVALLGYLVRLLRLPARRLGKAEVRGHGGHRGPASH